MSFTASFALLFATIMPALIVSVWSGFRGPFFHRHDKLARYLILPLWMVFGAACIYIGVAASNLRAERFNECRLDHPAYICDRLVYR